MRAILAFAIFALGINGAAPETEFRALFADYVGAWAQHASQDLLQDANHSLVDIESSIRRGDRLVVAALAPRALAVRIFRPDTAGTSLMLASASADVDSDVTGALIAVDPGMATDSDSNRSVEVSLGDLCQALFTSAQDNDLPIPFFANLLWQESRLKDDAVSKKGAMGIAQFMPTTAAESGLDDPFDPLQAIPASARLLRDLRMEFGNLGLVAAAYNAGPRRVAEWLQHRRSLPRETRAYVARVTGLPAEAWRKIPIDDAALTFVRRLPCRSLPAFASLEQQQLPQAEQEHARVAEAQAQVAALDRATPKHVAESKHDGPRDRRAAKREAVHHAHVAPAKRKSV